jgi:hypothetical protein
VAKQQESAVQGFCKQMSKSIHHYYDRKCETFDQIVGSALDKRESFVPNPKLDVNEGIKDVTLAPWQFQTLSGAKPTSWPLNLPNLIEKLNAMPPLGLFAEPIDLLPESKDFYEQARTFISETCKKAESCKEG